MATVIYMPPHKSLGESLGEGLGGAFEERERRKKEEALREWQRQAQTATTLEDFLSVPMPEGMLEDIDDVQAYYDIAAQRFPEAKEEFDLVDVFDSTGAATKVRAPKNKPPTEAELSGMGFTYRTPQEKTQWYADAPTLTPAEEQPTRPRGRLTYKEWEAKHGSYASRATRTNANASNKEWEERAAAAVQELGLPDTTENRRKAMYIRDAAPVADAHIEKVYAERFGSDITFGSKAEQVKKAKALTRDLLLKSGGDPIERANAAMAVADAEFKEPDVPEPPAPKERKGVLDTLGDMMRGKSDTQKAERPQPAASASPYPDGTELIGPNGERYVVVDGVPVLKGSQ